MKLKKISLQNLGKAEMARKEQSLLRGGENLPNVCITNCSCKYQGPQEGPNDNYYGGSDTNSNSSANGERLKVYG